MDMYILDGKTPVKINDLDEWSVFINDIDKCRVGLDKIRDVEVSTVFLGLSAKLDDFNRPLLFETMIFSDKEENDYVRYATWHEAERGHRKIAQEVRESQN